MSKKLRRNRIDREQLEIILSKVQKPGRYIGGEYGSIIKRGEDYFDIVISYPDLYEIGMSNLSVKILYSLFNSIEGIRCERVFAPAPDMERELRENGIPLFSLETKRSIYDFDVIGFSIGYELTLTNILNILELGGIEPLKKKRGENDPIVIAGGPAITNPIPFSPFIDCFFLGEAEEWILKTFPSLVNMKKTGASRGEILKKILEDRSIWSDTKEKKTLKSFWGGFSEHTLSSASPVPSIKIAQDHGVVEIMRGCPNICRFCSATIFYRPYRQRRFSKILEDVEKNVFNYGYNEITLSSLSTGDYKNILKLINILNKRFKNIGISFSLPSLRIDSLSLEIFDEISVVRKSGLTFAVETPLSDWQKGINKTIDFEKIVEILRQAKNFGWKLAKFYFMIGLPLTQDSEVQGEKDGVDEEVIAISNFVNELYERVKINLNINISTFVPKAHTPFQWAPQISEERAFEAFNKIKQLTKYRAIKIKYHSPFLSFLEGILSRGDSRAGLLFYKAFKAGARLDAWEDYLNKNLWREVIKNENWEVAKETYRARELDEKLPWDTVSLGTSKKYLIEEYNRAKNHQTTTRCLTQCKHRCGVCSKNITVVDAEMDIFDIEPLSLKKEPQKILFSFCKKNNAKYLSHLDVMRIFERAILRGSYLACMTEGFNPKPKLEFAHPLMLGMESEEEIATVVICNLDNLELFREKLNSSLPEGIQISRAKILKETRKSLMSLLWGSQIQIKNSFGDFSFDLEQYSERIKTNFKEIEIMKETPSEIHLKVPQIPKRGLKALTQDLQMNLNTFTAHPKPITSTLLMKREKLFTTLNNKPVSFFHLS